MSTTDNEHDMLIDGQLFKPGDIGVVKLNVGRLPSNNKITISAHVFRSVKPGPCTLILGGVHGDEINGIEIVRRMLYGDYFDNIKSGTIIVIPMLNIYGFINFNRYVPDGKDVNRSFPGTLSGSLASRIARTLTKHILHHVEYIFDFHTGGDSRFNYPQVRYTRRDSTSAELATVFNAPFLIETGVISKSLRKTARDLKIPILVYEGGESVRLDGYAIEHGLRGLINCLVHLKQLSKKMASNHKVKAVSINKTSWIRAAHAGIFIWTKESGVKVQKGEKLGHINDPNGQRSIAVISSKSGYIIGHNNASVVNQGDALFHIGYDISNTK